MGSEGNLFVAAHAERNDFPSRDLPLWRARAEKRVNLQAFVRAGRDLVADWLAYRNRRDAINAGPLLRDLEAGIEALAAKVRALIESCEPIARTVTPLSPSPHFRAVLPGFRDPRYLTVSGKPMFLVYRPLDPPDTMEFTDLWRKLALKAGLPGVIILPAVN